MSRISFTDTFSGSVTEGEDLTKILASNLKVNAIKIWAFTMTADSKIVFDLNNHSKATTMEIGNSYVLNIPHDTVLINHITPQSTGNIEMNYFYDVIN